MKKLGIGLLGLGTVGNGVASILLNPAERNPLTKELGIARIAVRDINKARDASLPKSIFTQSPEEVVDDPNVELVVEVMGGLEPARTLILRAIKAGKSVVTANKAVIARYGEEISAAAKSAGVYVLIEAAVGGGIPIIEPIKQSLGSNRIQKISGIINGTTNYILTRMSKEGANYKDIIKDAQNLGYAEADPAADVDGLDAADKIAILSGLAFGGSIDRSKIHTVGISTLKSRDIDYANELGYTVKLLAIAEKFKEECDDEESLPLSIWVEPTLVPSEHPLATVNGVNNAILINGSPIGEVMFYGPGAGAGPTASAVVADILNIAGIKISKGKDNNYSLDPLLAGNTWRECHLVETTQIIQKNYVRLKTEDSPGVIGRIGTVFGNHGVSIQSIVQFDASEAGAEIVVITHEVSKGQMQDSLAAITSLKEVKSLEAKMVCV